MLCALEQRPYWRYYYASTNAIVCCHPWTHTHTGALGFTLYLRMEQIFVVDSADKARIEIAREELHAMLAEEELKNAVLLVFANKQDLPDTLNEAQVSEALGLPSLKNRQWAIFKTSATKGVGLVEGLDWLANAIQSQR